MSKKTTGTAPEASTTDPTPDPEPTPSVGTTSWAFTNVDVPAGQSIADVDLDTTNVPAQAVPDVQAAVAAAASLVPDNTDPALTLDISGWSNGVQNSVTVVVTNSDKTA